MTPQQQQQQSRAPPAPVPAADSFFSAPINNDEDVRQQLAQLTSLVEKLHVKIDFLSRALISDPSSSNKNKDDDEEPVVEFVE